MADEQQEQPNADTAPPGSSESFNQFKDRILTAVTGYATDNEGHNTLLVTHSKPLKVMDAWEHAGYPENQDVHNDTYHEEAIKPGGNEELSIPQHVLNYLHHMFFDPNPGVEYAINKTQEQAGKMRNQILDTPKQIMEHPEQLVTGGELGVLSPEAKLLAGKVLKSVTEDGLSYTQAAEEHGVTRSAVAGIVKRYKDNPTFEDSGSPTSNKYGRGYWQEGGEGDQKLLELHRAGKTPKEIADEFGISVRNVQQMLSERDLVGNFNYKDSPKMNNPSQQQQAGPLSWRQIQESWDKYKKDTVSALQSENEVHQENMSNLQQDLTEAIREEYPDFNEASVKSLAKDAVKGKVPFDLPGSISHILEEYQDANRNFVYNKRAQEVVEKDPKYYHSLTQEQKDELKLHTDAYEKSYSEWEEEAKEKGIAGMSSNPNPYLAAVEASKGEWSKETMSHSIGGKKTAIVSPYGKLHVYQNGQVIHDK